MKTLSLIDVQMTAHQQFRAKGYTTALEIKNALRQQGFDALQEEVALWLDELAIEENWDFDYNGKHRIYSLGSDEKYIASLYLCKKNLFWEGELHDKTIWITQGKKESTMQERKVYQHTFPKSRIAWTTWKQLITKHYQLGYEAQSNPFLAKLRLRYLYKSYLPLKPISCLISYRNAKKYQAEGKRWLEITGSYVLGWELPQHHSSLMKVLRKATWNSTDIATETVHTHHEQTLLQAPLKIEQPSEKPILEIDNSHVYEAELIYENGEVLTLSAYDWRWNDELFPLIRWLVR